MPVHPDSASRSKSGRKRAAEVARPLKRNAACHQCRKRKMKCDARRPCTACLRSHGHLVEHSPASVEVPPYPECTYDEVDIGFDDETKEDESYRKLEERIDELEGLLHNMTIQLESTRAKPNNAQIVDTLFLVPTTFDTSPEPSSSAPEIVVTTEDSSGMTFSYGLADALTALPNTVASNQTEVAQLDLYDERLFAVTASGWSAHLPDPSTTRHMVNMFFKFNVYANHLFHAPTFLASLNLHPMDPRFPPVGILHAICALGSLYTAEKSHTSMYTDLGFPYIAVNGRWAKRPVRALPFSVHHCRLAWLALAKYFESGDHLLEETQTNILLTLFDMYRASWVDVFRNSGEALRSTVPLGLCTCPPFKIRRPPLGTAGPIVQDPMILPPPESATDEELRRNIFWLTYILDRQQSISRDLALALDDRDIGQLLPVRGDYFHYGLTIPIEERQWSTDPDLLLRHPPQHTDSFILYVKSAILITRVKNFNVRYRGRYYSGDPSMRTCDNTSNDPFVEDVAQQRKLLDDLKHLDPRGTQAFEELDTLLLSFRTSLPTQFTMPVKNGRVDALLYSVLIVSHLATILLHDPHVNLDDPACPSRIKLLQASQGILELIYLISSTSYDVSLLDHFAISGWYFAGREIARFLRSAIRCNNAGDIITHCAELNDIHTILGKAGKLLSTAHQYQRILTDVISQTCGEQYVPGQTSWTSVPPAALPESQLTTMGMRSLARTTYTQGPGEVGVVSLLDESSRGQVTLA